MPSPSKTFTPNPGRGLTRDEIDALRARHPIEHVIAAYVDLRPVGRLLQARCPLPGHDDPDPSFTVYPENQSFYCYGCNRGGDVFTFIKLVEQVNFREAIEKLEAGAFTKKQRVSPPVMLTSNGIHQRPVGEEQITLLTAAAEVYHVALLGNGEMLGYITRRGIDLEMIRRFRLGYATGDNLARYFRFRGWDPEVAKELGLIGERGEFFRQRIIIPELRLGRAIYLTGRRTADYQRVKYLGLAGAPKPLYGAELVRGSRDVFVCEGPFDRLTLIKWGYAAVALLGSHLKSELAQDLVTAERIYIVTDSDKPGRESAAKLAEIFGARARIVPCLPNAKDVNELAARPHAREIFADLVRQVE